MTATATPVSAATEQEHQYNDNQEQFHGISPLMAMALFAAPKAFNGILEVLFPISVQPPLLALRDVSNSAQSRFYAGKAPPPGSMPPMPIFARIGQVLKNTK
jgi:hypothetical protein